MWKLNLVQGRPIKEADVKADRDCETNYSLLLTGSTVAAISSYISPMSFSKAFAAWGRLSFSLTALLVTLI